MIKAYLHLREYSFYYRLFPRKVFKKVKKKCVFFNKMLKRLLVGGVGINLINKNTICLINASLSEKEFCIEIFKEKASIVKYLLLNLNYIFTLPLVKP